MTSPLPPDVAAALATPGVRERLGGLAARLTYQSTVTSTSDICLALARRGAPDGTTVLASGQTAGRGRHGRHWFSPVGHGLYVSVLLRDVVAPALTLLTGVAVAEGVRTVTGLDVELEWPNDVVLSGVARPRSGRRPKVGGVLCEAYSQADPAASTHSLGVVIGIGINLATVDYPPDIARRAVSLESSLGRSVDRGALFVETLAALARWRTVWATDGADPILARWRTLSPSSRDAGVRWDTPTGRHSGVTAGIDHDGALLVTIGERTERIVGGTLEWLPEGETVHDAPRR